MFKKILFAIVLFFVFPLASSAADNDLYFFWANGCPHCSKEKVFLDSIQDKYPNLVIHSLEVTGDSANVELLMSFGEKFHTDISGVPFTVVGEEYFIGYYNDQTTGAQIEEAIDKLQLDTSHFAPAQPVVENEQPDNIGQELPIDDNNIEEDGQPAQDNLAEGKIEAIPEVAGFNLSSMSLPVITIVLGFLDGFNPCAMWALIFLITLLLGMQDRKRMWILGTTFVITSAFVYFLFMAAWLNLLSFLDYIPFTRVLIGLVALGGGVWNFKKFFGNRDGTCEVSSGEKKQKVFAKLKNITQQQNFFLALTGIILLAFAVNLVELICSAGLPTVYTQVLILNNLTTWQYYGYILLYIFFFMLDDLLVFFVAMTTLHLTGLSTKYSRWSSLIGGIVMIAIGLLLIFKHEILMFG